jgi:hypothetical protein
LPLLWLAFAGKSTTKREKGVRGCYAPKSEKGKGTFVSFSMNVRVNSFKVVARGEVHHLQDICARIDLQIKN